MHVYDPSKIKKIQWIASNHFPQNLEEFFPSVVDISFMQGISYSFKMLKFTFLSEFEGSITLLSDKITNLTIPV